MTHILQCSTQTLKCMDTQFMARHGYALPTCLVCMRHMSIHYKCNSALIAVHSVWYTVAPQRVLYQDCMHGLPTLASGLAANPAQHPCFDNLWHSWLSQSPPCCALTLMQITFIDSRIACCPTLLMTGCPLGCMKHSR